MLRETDVQVREACGRDPDMCIVPVGVGSVAQAVVAHYCARDPAIRSITVEPEAAACLMESLHHGEIVPISTGETIMPGMNCGTVSSLAWPILEHGVHTTVAVRDTDSHECVGYLTTQSINAGPCAAATLAAARLLRQAGMLGKEPDTVLVFFSTEGTREYELPPRT